MTATATSANVAPAAAAATELADVRVLLVHEWLYSWAGAERCLEQLVALMPHADVLAGVIDPRMRHASPIARRAKESWVGAIPGARRHHRWFLPAHPLAFATFDTSRYDLVISISHAFEKSIRARGDGAHLSYCLTPPRFLWDQRDAHAALASPAQRLALRVGGGALRALDRRAARNVDHFVAISHFVADRIRRCYGRDSAVVYPPVAAKSEARTAIVSPVSAERPYLLSLGRLVPYKRVDLAVLAAERLGHRLVVAGDGPERRRLQHLAGPYTEFVGPVSEGEAARLLANCAAFVFCAEEDFGIAPVEANAHGAPVVAFGRGGAAESMVDGDTAVLFAEQTVDSLVAAIERALSTTWDREALRRNAARFSPDRFREGMRREIARALALRS